MNFHKIRVKSSIPIVLLATALLTLFLAFSHLIKLQEQALEAQSNQFLKAISVVLNADRDLYQAELAQTKLISGLTDPQSAKQEISENAQQVKNRFNEYRKYLSSYPNVVSQFQSFDQAFVAWENASTALQLASTQQPNQDLSSLKQTAELRFNELRSVLDKAGEAAEIQANKVQQILETEITAFKTTAMIFLFVVLLIAGWFSYKVPKLLTEQINYLTKRVNEIASGEGDLRARIEVSSKDEFGELATEFNRFVESLRELIVTILDQASDLTNLTATLTESSEKTRSITTTINQASDSIVSAVHEMNLSNKQMAEVANGTATEADTSSQMAKQGIQVVEQSNESISHLSSNMETALHSSSQLQKSSENIASVLDVIRGIAEQTNLLALNAAIEAARAGEQGRGFAVVADEVRTLATRTQESTNHIHTMIEQLTASVGESARSIANGKQNADDTVSIFQEANEVFNTLLQSSVRLNDMSTQTAQATEEQSTVSDEISQNLFSLNEQTTSATAIAESSEQLAAQIKDLANNLSDLVGRFKV
ncbi:methyl-accepting chemotaxis protein [Catenovulum adriaticum]|uniref:Methyl-accepting chemotaxis protein n=1 Tax=Catenovulum adriaticum TaxID=2984846 RepID=A0ABY7AQZ0_9ALTE|nr:methyl-accepting chemotaxis protein [Catenovulum sp. TS8]WAJ71086.1 methyl-accepting chemotaxis protein [Catenovulum sp. TS8]